MRPVNPWVVAVTVTLATFMEVLDSTVTNVSLPYIAGDLAVSVDEASWTLTTYLVANAVVLPVSGWASGLIGRKRFYMICVLLFTVSSALVGMAPSLEWLLIFRVFQGAGGGGLQPSEQGILLDTFAPEKRGMAMALYAVAILFAPIIGPTLGGYITENYTWRWIFFINIPVGILSLFLTNLVVHDPPYLEEQRRARRGKPLDIDAFGLGLIAIGLGSLEIIYDRGQEDDWFNSPLILILTVLTIVCLGTMAVWEWRHPHPIVNLQLLKDRNFTAGCLIIFLSIAVVYGANVLLPVMAQALYGYDAYTAGLVMSPGGIAVLVFMPVSGWLISRRVDARYLIVFGALAIAAASYWTAHLTLEASPWVLVIRRCAQLFGMAFIFAPVNVAAYMYLPSEQTNNATGLFNMLRNEGASLGIALFDTLTARRNQFHQSRLVDRLTPLDEPFRQLRDQLAQPFQIAGYDPVTAGQMALAQINRMLQQQVQFLSYMDLFWVLAWVALAIVPCVLLMRRSVAEKGALAMGH